MSSASVTPALPRSDVRPRLGLWGLADARPLLLVIVLGLAVLTRLLALDAAGFSEDEMDKLHAADLYRQGVFTFDGEHPALMKLAVLGSLEAAGAWNAIAPLTSQPSVSVETAVRLPNAIAGALTTLILFLLVEQLFSSGVAVFAAWFWVFDLNAMAVNRIAKEDTFALLFLLAGALLYEYGKRAGATVPAVAQRWFAASGAAFGLMLASKYLPYLFGIHVLYCRLAAPRPGRNRPDKIIYLGALAGTFLLANFPILFPGNWRTIAGFVSERAIQHSGYLFHGRLWLNAVTAPGGGLPWWFYLAEFWTKVPLAVLFAAAIGLWRLAAARRTRGGLFVWTFLLLTLVPYSLIPTKFLRYMLPTLAMLDVIAAVGVMSIVERAPRLDRTRRAAVLIATAALTLAPAAAWSHARPFVGLYRNTLGTWLSPASLWFPPDELYDAGLREAMADIAGRALPGSGVITEAPAVAGFYAAAHGRSDLIVRRPESARPGSVEWFIVQDGRIYFDNYKAVQRARQGRPTILVDVDGFRAVEVYRVW